MFHLICVDDSIFLFESLQDMENGAQTIHDHYARFGLVMHVGRGYKKSKTEAMHVPAKLDQEPIPEGTRDEDRIERRSTHSSHNQIQVSWIQDNFQAE
jgi:hypothetical protein